MRVISFYTIDTPYEDEAKRLEKSLRRLGIEYAIAGLPSLGSWVANCAQKARFIRDEFNTNGGDFWWFDADAELAVQPERFDPEKVDIAIALRHGWDPASGSCFFGTSNTTARLIDLWTEYCETYPFVWDQLLLGFALHNIRIVEPINVVQLSNAYIRKYKKGKITIFFKKLRELVGIRPAPIVRQYQASQRLKNAVLKVNPENPSNHIEIGDRSCPDHIRQVIAGRRSEPIDVGAVVEQMVKAEYGISMQSQTSSWSD